MNTESNRLSDDQKIILLKLARTSIELAVNDQPSLHINPQEYTAPLNQPGASFVTLTKNRNLRGCIGALTPYQPLVEDVYEHAAAAAQNDYRFSPVKPEEIAILHIEISRLTLPHELVYNDPKELPRILKPGKDGVILHDGFRKATFLPQVWLQIPNPETFLTQLCLKMGASENIWRQKNLKVEIYEVEEFEE